MNYLNLNIRFASALVVGAVMLSSCHKDDKAKPSSNPTVTKVISGTSTDGQPKEVTEAPAGNVITLVGSGLEGINSIWFENANVPAGVKPAPVGPNPAMNTDNAITFRVPDTAWGGPSTVVLKNINGTEARFPLKVIALASVTQVSDYSYSGNQAITLTGNNLNGATATVKGSNAPLTVVSATKTQMIVSFPVGEAATSQIDITNSSGVTSYIPMFVNQNMANVVFSDTWGTTWGENSWGSAAKPTADQKQIGTMSVTKTFAKSNWHRIGFSTWSAPVKKSDNYKYISMWVKGGTINIDFWVVAQSVKGGDGTYNDALKFTVPKNVWTYLLVPLNSAALFESADQTQIIGFRLKGPDSGDEAIYFDDVMLVK